MALSSEELSHLRQLIDEPSDQNGWTDDRIKLLGVGAIQPDDSYDLRLYASLLWEAKAAESVKLVDVAESGSSRSAGQIFQHAKDMAARFRAPAQVPSEQPISPRGTRVGKIVRE